MTTTYANLIDGEMVTTSNTFEVVNPANEEVVGLVPSCGKDELDRAVAAARRAFKTWKKTSAEERQKVVMGISAAIKDNADELFRLLTTEQGKPHAQAQGEIIGASMMAGAQSTLDLDDEINEDVDEPITFSIPSSVSRAQKRPRTIRLRTGDTLPVHILSVSPQSSQFRVTTDPSLVRGKKAKDLKKESGAAKKLERLSQMLGGLHKAEELRGREYDGTVKATSQTGDWLYVQPNGNIGDDLNLPVGVATVPEDEVTYFQGDLVRITMEGIDESRGQLAMRVIEKLSP